jgi:DNA polymerase III epsilon subunit-like protein
LDAEILADVYLAMTGGQTMLSLDATEGQNTDGSEPTYTVDFSQLSLPIVEPSNEELQNHVEWIARLDEKVEGQCVWSRINEKSPTEQ